MLFDIFTATPDLRAMPADEVNIATTIRLWVALGKFGRDPIPPLAERLGSREGAVRLHLLLDLVGSVWTDSFHINPPCCPRLSHDEGLVIDMIRVARRRDRAGFDRMLSEMLPMATRDRLFASISRFLAVLPAPASGF